MIKKLQYISRKRVNYMIQNFMWLLWPISLLS